MDCGAFICCEASMSPGASWQGNALAAREENAEGAALGNRIMGLTLWAMGAFVEARRCLEWTLDFCLPGQTDLRFWRDNAVSAQTYLGVTLLPLGYPEQAAASVTNALTAARALGHATTIGNALYADILLAGAFGTDPQRAAIRADETAAYSLEHSLTLYLPWARFYQGVSLARRGDPRHGIEVMRAALEAAEKINAELLRPIHLGHLAAAHANAGRAEAGLDLLNEAIRAVEKTKEGLFEAALHRMRGELLLGLGEKGQAEAELVRALAVARSQEARMWELRSATSLARLWRSQGRRTAARNLLAPVYDWFTEGCDIGDLKQAKALLDRLA
jgi:predicted ATPase